jgi:hypothetical protein
MKSYRLQDGDTLVFSADEEPWHTVTFESKDFEDVGAATAEEVAEVLNRSGSLAAYADEQGALVLASVSAGGHASLDVDVEHSTAAAALGLTGAQASARGDGLRAARLVSQKAEPFDLARGSELTLFVDEHRRRVVFDEDEITPGAASAAEVARAINAKKKKVAEPTRDGRVALTSNTIGADSKLLVEPAPPGKQDAASALGFVGASAADRPHRAEPARMVCAGRESAPAVVNLSSGPVELLFLSGATVLPAGASAPLAPGDAASEQLQRLIEQGVVRIVASAPDVVGAAGQVNSQPEE